MARETRAATRTDPTAPHAKLKGKDKLKSIRKATSTTKATHTIATMHDWCLLRNDGAADSIKVNFKSDNMATNYWTLKPGESLPCAIGVAKNVTIHYQAVSGTPDLEIILWA